MRLRSSVKTSASMGTPARLCNKRVIEGDKKKRRELQAPAARCPPLSVVAARNYFDEATRIDSAPCNRDARWVLTALARICGSVAWFM